MSVENFTYESMSEGFQRRFEAVANELGDFPALRFGDKFLSYKDLNQRADHIASAIQKASDSRFIITWLSDEILMITAIMAIAKLGRVWVPVNYKTPPAIIAQYIKKFDDAAFFTNQSLPDELKGMEHQVIDSNQLEPGEKLAQSKAFASGDFVHIVPTSGSTGVPKGVPRNSESVNRNLHTFVQVHETKWREQIAFVGDPSFASNIATIKAALVRGATLHIINLNQMSFGEFHQYLREHRVSSLHCVSSVFRVAFADVKPGDFPDLAMVKLGGEATFKSDFELFKANFARPCKFVNGFGSTEVSGVSFFVADHDTVIQGERLPVGIVRPYIKVKFRNEAGEFVVGEEGEMYFYDKLMQPYWNDPQASEGKFFPDSEDPEWIVYRSGDYGIMLDNGNLVHLGRRDNQVKVRGQKVELAAVENRFREHPTVAEVSVQPYERKGETRLAAYVVAKEGENLPNDNVWRAFLGKGLSEHMIPSRFIVLDEMPRLPNGKFNAKGLPDPTLVKIERQSSVIQAKTEREKKLLAMWQDILDFSDEISIEDSFFDLGGSSLQATALISDVNEQFNVVLTPAMLYQYPSIQRLAAFIDDGGINATMHPSIVPFRPFGSHYPLFCLPGSLGNPLAFKGLAHRLERDYPIYGLQMQGLDGKEPLPQNLDELLAYYETAIKSLGLKIPIYLIGLSVGGVHAYELAQRLQKQDVSVEAVILLDTFFPSDEQNGEFDGDEEEAELLQSIHQQRRQQRYRQQKMEKWTYRIQHYGQRLLSLPGKALQYAMLPSDERRLKWEERQKTRAEAKQINERANAGNHLDMKKLLNEIRQTSRRTAADYRPESYAGNMFYIKALQNQMNPGREEHWAKQIEGNFSLFEIDTPHTMLNIMHLDKVVEVLKEEVLL